jgi:hypothetical protein
MSGNRLPARVDRATFERVLQRAAEIQASSRDIGDGLTEDEILALGTEVGIPAQHLKQALLEERTRAVVPVPDGTVDRWVGVANVAADRVVQGTQEQILAALSRWLEHHEHFVVQRATIGRTTFEPMPAFMGAMRKVGAMFDAGRSKPYLDRVDLVTAVVTPLEDGFCHVSLAASLRGTRQSYVIGMSVAAALGLVSAGGVGLLGAAELVPLLPAAGGLGISWVTARAYRSIPERTQLGLERTLDELERAPARPALKPQAGSLARNVGEAVREITSEVRKALEK